MQVHILSFEGPDRYASVGGLATRVQGLTQALAEGGFETHLWFVGDSSQPGEESHGRLNLHRWCQWISRHHPGGVYDGEEGKVADYAASLPPFLVNRVLLPHLAIEGQAVVLAEEWQTADAVTHLDWLLRRAGLRQQVSIFWNANNTFGFEGIDWHRLRNAAAITTVSRYMKHRMQSWNVDPVVIPNGLAPDAFLPPDRAAVKRLRAALKDRVVFAKMARWDPDKRWLATVGLMAELKRHWWHPLLIARGGNETHGWDVLAAACRAGLTVVERAIEPGGLAEMVEETLANVNGVDVINIRTPVDAGSRRVLFRAADVVLANSSHEPFGLVGLETMAVGGIACTGCSGEDYVIPERNALVLQTGDPREFLGLYGRLRADPGQLTAMRRAARWTARQYAWPEVLRRNLLPRVEILEPIVHRNGLGLNGSGSPAAYPRAAHAAQHFCGQGHC